MESKFEVEDGHFVRRDMHNSIKESIEQWAPDCVVHINNMEKEMILLKEKGFEIIYSLKCNPSDFK